MASDTRAWDVSAALSWSALVAGAVAIAVQSSSVAQAGEMRWSPPGRQAEEVLALTGEISHQSKNETTDDTIHWIGRATLYYHEDSIGRWNGSRKSMRFRREAMRSVLGFVAVLIVLGCGDDDDGGAAGTGGSAGSGGTNAPSGGAGAAGDSGAGSDSSVLPEDGMLGRLPDASWDTTLGGFNQDLSEPSTPCEVRESRTAGGCMSVSGTYNGEPFDGQGYASTAFVHVGNDYRGAGMDYEIGPDDIMRISTKIGMLVAPTAPSTFEAPVPGIDPTDAQVLVMRDARNFESHDSYNEPLATHDIEYRMAGELWFAQSRPDGPRHEQVLANFAVSITPLPDCQPDADGFGCDEVRLRGTMTGATLRALPAP